MASLIDPNILLPTYTLLSGLFSPVSNTASTAQTPSTSIAARTQVSISSLGQLLSALDSFQSTLQSLYSTWQSMQPVANSSNSSVATAYSSSATTNGNYTISVNSLAQSQTLQSNGYASTGSVIGSGSLTVQTGTVSGTTFTSDGSTPATISIANGTLAGIANAINTSGSSINATIVSDASNLYHLVLASNSPGSSKGFTVASSGDAALANFAWTPASPGSMTLTQQGSNASFSVNSVASSYAGNTGIGIGNGLYLNLAGTGSTQISVATSLGSVSDSAQQFVSAFNALQTSINALIGTNIQTGVTGGLRSDPIANRLVGDLNHMALGSFSNGSSSLTSLLQIGIDFQFPQSYGLGGTLTLNSGGLQLAFGSDTNGTVGLIRTAAQSFYNLSNSYSNFGTGSIPLTLTALNKQLATENVLNRPAQGTLPGSIASLLISQASTAKGGGLTAQQLYAMMQYASIYALSSPYSVQSALIGNIASLPSASGSRSGNTVNAVA
ncbi:flagellar filament capping protein FliD [Paludibacterium paludis]|uniref:Flagellar hook-associated protein 2 n=1 Tax=Paludibacterium paludis TaxID=1225769 RepID=A0A918P5D8_9NEIS|nr:flagellar filament capping protein FliD [Paludibacterium paludis]GGY25495.1 hypothetical protein GCM10011289_31380 [Paludibacterium paludis]